MEDKVEAPQPKKRVGRPKGSTNKSKSTPTTRKPRATTRSTKNKSATKQSTTRTTPKTSTTSAKRGRPKKEETAINIVKRTASKLDALASDMEKLLQKTKK